MKEVCALGAYFRAAQVGLPAIDDSLCESCEGGTCQALVHLELLAGLRVESHHLARPNSTVSSLKSVSKIKGGLYYQNLDQSILTGDAPIGVE